MEQSVYLKKTIVQKALTDAEGIRLIGLQVKEDPAFMDLQKITFAVELSEILSKSRNKILLNTDMLLLDIFSDVVTDDKSRKS